MNIESLDLTAIKAEHQPWHAHNECEACGDDYPCLPYLLAVRAEEAEANLARLDEQVDELFVRVEAGDVEAAQLANAVLAKVFAFLRGPQ